MEFLKEPPGIRIINAYCFSISAVFFCFRHNVTKIF